jgi:transcriptional regulator with XRE-family HTH domain
MEGIGQRIYEERKKKGLSQGVLAEQLDVSAKAVSKWETGEAQPTLDNVSRLAEIFGVSTDYLLKGNDGNGKGSAAHLHYLEPQKETRHKIRTIAWIVLAIGLLFMALGLVLFFSDFFDMTMDPSRGVFGIIFISLGGIVLMVDLVLMIFGYAGSVGRYAASEVAPVVKDTSNYMMSGTRDEFGKTIQTVAGSVKEGLTPSDKGPVCPKCGTLNEKGACYCDNCGAALTKKCPACGEINDEDAKHCRKCGKELQ